jgi:hypothetical protein
MVQGTTQDQQRQPVFKVRTHIKAGYYVGLILSAGQGSSAST